MINFKSQLTGNWYYYRDNFYPSNVYAPENTNYLNSIYEVLRIVNKIPVFVEDHYNRFENSLKSLSIAEYIDLNRLKIIIRELSEKNTISSGNIRFEVLINELRQDFVLYQVPHVYPTENQCQQGVELMTFSIERLNPQVKQSAVNQNVRTKIAALFQQHPIYEVLLVNHLNEVTEGSKSNIFFISGNTLFSPPTAAILEGITRKRLLRLLDGTNFKLIETTIPLDYIAKFEGCFLTGTSPKILPVKQINKITFNPRHKGILDLMSLFNQHMEDYCKNYR